MDVLTAIKDRKSTRAFIDKPVDKYLIEKILEIARYSPSGVNTQPWKVIVVKDDIKNEIGNAIITARDNNIKENPDYNYYPKEWLEPYKTRRKECGLALYSALDIKKDEIEKRKVAWYKNYHFFHAPIGMLFFVESFLDKGSWLDMGMFIQSVMLAARGCGLETCPQASIAEYPDIVRNIVNVDKKYSLVCGMALGYADINNPVNQYRTSREEVSSFASFIGF